MATTRRIPLPGQRGFSLVEMLVALVFTGILMAGMSQVFKSSLTSFYTSSEQLSSSRRNRLSVDMLFDDLNSAAMYLTSLNAPPSGLSAANPAFYIIPNQAIAGAAADGPQAADEIYFYLDQPLAFEGSILPGGNIGRSAAEVIDAGGVASVSDSVFDIDCGDPSYAKLVKVGHSFVLKDAWETLYVSNVSNTSSSVVRVTVAAMPGATITGIGSQGAPSKYKHLPNARVLFYAPAQMVKYSIQMMNLDPQNPAGVPCLVREQGAYNSGGFVAETTALITENVADFKAYLSTNSRDWAGYGQTYAGFDAGWTNGIRSELDAQLATSGREGFKSTAGLDHWFRKIPTLVRVDVTTRTALKRSEYSPTGTTVAYKNILQSLVIVPRHFGLPLN